MAAPQVSVPEFLADQVALLEPFEFVVLSGPDPPFPSLEVGRDEAGDLHLRILTGEPQTLSELQRGSLQDLGFAPAADPERGSIWERRIGADGGGEAVAVAGDVLHEVFGIELRGPLDVHHGSRRKEIEARRNREALRARIEPILTDLIGSPPTLDPDGDWVFLFRKARVFVAPRTTSDGRVIVRVFAITNVGLPITPQLALFIASLNFGLAFCRFALDAQHGAVWVDETLLGDLVSDEELRFTVETVASTAADWEGRIKEMFGGFTAQDVLSGRSGGAAPGAKPGNMNSGGYL